MSLITKSFTEFLSLQKLQASDNTEWTGFMGYFGHRLLYFVRSLSGRSRFDEDIVANVLADIYVTRNIYESTDHMVKHMFATARFSTYNTLYRGNKSFLMDDDMLIQVDSIVSQREEEEMSLEDREKYEEWKDQMHEAIEHQSDRLPKKWKEFILTYLYGNRKDVKQIHKAMHISGDQKYKNVLRRIRTMIEMSQSGPATTDQIEQIRLTFRYFAHIEKLVFSEALQCESLDKIADKLKMDKHTVSEALNRCIRQLRKVWNDPMMEKWTSHIEFVHSLKEERILEIVKEELLNKESLAKRYGIKLTHGQLIEVIQMREQLNLPWNEIGRRMNIDPKILKRHYLEESLRGVATVVEEIPLEWVLEIRKKYRNEEATISSLSAEYKLPRARIIAIIEGMDWKIAGSKVILERKSDPSLSERDVKILELYDEGMKFNDIAKQLGCGALTVTKVIRDSGHERAPLKERIQELLKKGFTRKQIAKQLNCSIRTVESYAA